MKRLWPVVILLAGAAAVLPFLPLRRIAWRMRAGDDFSAYPRSVVWFMSRQQSEGSWDEGPATLEGHPLGRPGQTGLALLTFLGQGYSHLSKDEYEWYVTGQSVRKGLRWLLNDQRPDGTFRSSAGALDHALATLALSEAYGMTNSNLFKSQARSALDALDESLRAGGLKDDATLHAWALMALWSGQISDLPASPEAWGRLRAFYDARESPADAREVVARIAMEKRKTHPRLAPAIDRLATRPPRWEQQDFAAWYWGTIATSQYDGPSGPAWRAWNDPLRNTLVRSRSSRGDWPGKTRGETLVRTALAELTLNNYYRRCSQSVPAPAGVK
jgi:hypothetical protein